MRALRPRPLPARMRAAAARLAPTSTGCSRGAESCGFGHVSRAARCLLACWRLAKTPASSPCLPAAAGVRVGRARRRAETRRGRRRPEHELCSARRAAVLRAAQPGQGSGGVGGGLWGVCCVRAPRGARCVRPRLQIGACWARGAGMASVHGRWGRGRFEFMLPHCAASKHRARVRPTEWHPSV